MKNTTRLGDEYPKPGPPMQRLPVKAPEPRIKLTGPQQAALYHSRKRRHPRPAPA